MGSLLRDNWVMACSRRMVRTGLAAPFPNICCRYGQGGWGLPRIVWLARGANEGQFSCEVPFFLDNLKQLPN